MLYVLTLALLCASAWSSDIVQDRSNSETIIDSVRLGALIHKLNETLDDDIVDRDIALFPRVYHKGNLCPFKRSVVSKMIRKEPIDIYIIGGSVTYGADLPDRLRMRWSQRFTDIMTSGWYSGVINVRNIAVGACNLDVWIDKVNEVKNADLVIIDLSVNDQGFDLQGLPVLYQNFIQVLDNLPKHPALLIHYAFRTGQNDKREFGHCPNVRDQVCGVFLTIPNHGMKSTRRMDGFSHYCRSF